MDTQYSRIPRSSSISALRSKARLPCTGTPVRYTTRPAPPSPLRPIARSTGDPVTASARQALMPLPMKGRSSETTLTRPAKSASTAHVSSSLRASKPITKPSRLTTTSSSAGLLGVQQPAATMMASTAGPVPGHTAMARRTVSPASLRSPRLDLDPFIDWHPASPKRPTSLSHKPRRSARLATPVTAKRVPARPAPTAKVADTPLLPRTHCKALSSAMQHEQSDLRDIDMSIGDESIDYRFSPIKPRMSSASPVRTRPLSIRLPHRDAAEASVSGLGKQLADLRDIKMRSDEDIGLGQLALGKTHYRNLVSAVEEALQEEALLRRQMTRWEGEIAQMRHAVL